jgi:hypothetical protein
MAKSSSFHWIDILFPGVFVHEAAHALACYVCGVKVHRISVHRNSGMVVHDTASVRSTLLISLFPLLVGGAAAFFLLHLAKTEWSRSLFEGIFLAWLGISIGFHCLPSVQDVQNIVSATQRRFQALWAGPRNIVSKLGKSGVYAITWVGGNVLVILALILNATWLFRLLLGLALWWAS